MALQEACGEFHRLTLGDLRSGDLVLLGGSFPISFLVIKGVSYTEQGPFCSLEECCKVNVVMMQNGRSEPECFSGNVNIKLTCRLGTSHFALIRQGKVLHDNRLGIIRTPVGETLNFAISELQQFLNRKWL